MAGGELPRPAVSDDDRAAFARHEAGLLARRWRRIAPLAMIIVGASEVLAWITPSFPKAPLVTLAMEGVLAMVWLASHRWPSRRLMGVMTVVTGVAGAAFAASPAIEDDGFRSLHTLALPCILAFITALLVMSTREVAITVVLALVTWGLTVYFFAPGPIDAAALEVTLVYYVFLGVVTIAWVTTNRRLRLREFVARRKVEGLHRFAVEEVLCRHLPPRYVESVLAGRHLLDGPPERRVVTVVFADIVSFTPLSDSLSAEDLARVMARFYDVTSTIAFEHGATIDKFIGDAVMALLGAPEPLSPEEQARRALAMARAWQRAVHDLVPGGRELTLRIGIHQDAVAVGSFGGRHRTDYTVLGMGVNIAARLEGACPPGAILVSREVYERLEPRPAARAVGELELKGVPRPVAAFAVEGEAA